MNELELQLETIFVEHDELRVPYVISNRSADAAFVYNLVPDRFGLLAGKPDLAPCARLAQTCYDVDNIVVMALGEVRRPRRFPEPSYYSSAKPMAVRIDAGAGFRATIRAPLPLIEWSEIWMPRPGDPQLVRTPVHTLQIVAEFAFATDVTSQHEDSEHPGCFNINEKFRHRIIADQNIAALGVFIDVHPQAPHFA